MGALVRAHSPATLYVFINTQNMAQPQPMGARLSLGKASHSANHGPVNLFFPGISIHLLQEYIYRTLEG